VGRLERERDESRERRREAGSLSILCSSLFLEDKRTDKIQGVTGETSLRSV